MNEETLVSTQKARDQDRERARNEYERYKKMMATAGGEVLSETIHLVCNVAEKVLLPRLLRQPCQLHF